MKTYSTKKKDIGRSWHLIDLKGRVLGRAASKIAQILQGKDKVYYTSHLDCGDWVVAVNAKKIKVTGRKKSQKLYYRHSGYPGGFKQRTFAQLMDKDPRKVIELAVKNMLPKNKLRTQRLRRLKVFAGEDHVYEDKLDLKKKEESLAKKQKTTRAGKAGKSSNVKPGKQKPKQKKLKSKPKAEKSVKKIKKSKNK
jgi:large subunit ribosomal protein L13